MVEPLLARKKRMELGTLLTFAGAFLVFAASPGPDNVTIVARTLSHGVWSGLAYAAGMVTGILAVLVVAAAGLSVAMKEASALMSVLRYVGALWLVWMGLKLWTAVPVISNAHAAKPQGDHLATYFAGFSLNLANPKMPIFYLALLPGIVGPTLSLVQICELAATILIVEVFVVGGYVLLAERARRFFKSEREVRLSNRIAGGTMIGAGVVVAAAR